MPSAAVWTFVPVNAQPGQVFIHRRDKFCPAAVRIEVFIAKYQRTARLLRPTGCKQKSARVPEMEKPRG